MTGICGCLRGKNAPAALRAMLAALRYHHWYAEARHESASAALGSLSLKAVDVKLHRVDQDVAVIAGEIYDAVHWRQQLGLPANSDHAAICLHGYKRLGRGFFAGLNGKFAVAIWEEHTQRLTLIADRFGMRPLYYANLADGFVFASAVKGLLAAGVRRTPNLQAIAQFFAFQQFAGADTSVAGVRRLAPAGWVTFDFRSKRLTVETYWSPKSLLASPENPLMALERIEHAFAASMRRCASGPSELGLALSGGLDSRCILGLVDKDQTLSCVTLGLPGAMDLWVAERMAAVMNRPHYRSLLDASFFRNYEKTLRQMVHFTEGHVAPSGVTMPSLDLYRKLGVEVLMRGHGGELMHMARAYKYSLGAGGQAIDSTATLERWLLDHVAAGRAATPDMAFLSPACRALVEPTVRTVVRDWVNELRDITPLEHSLWLLFVMHHMPRGVGSSIVKFSSVLETRIPYLDADLLAALLAAPPSLKLGDRIQTHILSQHAPELLAAPNTNTGVSMGARRGTVVLAHFLVRVLAKLRVPGFQPYERLGLWLRREFAGLLNTVLLGEQCLDRGVFDREGVRKIIADHAACRRNHTNLLMSMLSFEVAARELMDGDNILETPLVPDAVRAKTRADMPAESANPLWV